MLKEWQVDLCSWGGEDNELGEINLKKYRGPVHRVLYKPEC